MNARSLVLILGLVSCCSLPVPAEAQSPSARAQPKLERAVPLEKVMPEYTPEARAAGLQGSVILYVEITAEGRVEKAEVLQSLGMGLDDKALEAIKRWTFKPGTKDGLPVNVEQSVEIQYHLPDNPWQLKRAYYQAHDGGFKMTKQLIDAVLTQYVKPDPKSCPANGGVAIVSLEVARDGKVQTASIVDQQGEPVGNTVVQSIRNWLFQPGSRNGKPVNSAGAIQMDCIPSGTHPSEDDSRHVPVYTYPNSAVTSPKLISKAEPQYSSEGREARLSGVVRIAVEVDQTGRVFNMVVTNPLGLGLDQEALKAVAQWRFKPGELDGQPVAVRAAVEVKFLVH